MKTMVLFCLSMLSLTGCFKANQDSEPGQPAPQEVFPKRLTVPGVQDHGIFDAAFARDPSSPRIWMAYSHVEASQMWPSQNDDVVSTRLAYSDDNGKSWTDTGQVVNPTKDVTLPLSAPLNAGTWTNEVSSLVYDPAAPLEARWKLVWLQYLLINDERRFEHGWLAMKSASSPMGLAAATPVKLFVGAGYDTSNDSVNSPTGSPISGAPKIHLDLDLHSQLNGCLFTEPGLMAAQGEIYMSVMCRKVVGAPESWIVILKFDGSGSMESASNWQLLGVALNDSDAAAAGFNGGYSAPYLYQEGNATYLLATPVKSPGDFYSGCHLFKFANLQSATLEREGLYPSIKARVQGKVGSFHGACAYEPVMSATGFVYSEVQEGTPERFQLFHSGRL